MILSVVVLNSFFKKVDSLRELFKIVDGLRKLLKTVESLGLMELKRCLSLFELFCEEFDLRLLILNGLGESLVDLDLFSEFEVEFMDGLLELIK